MEEIVKYHGCFVCGDKNPNGLRIKFYRDGDEAVATCIAEPKYQGYKGVYHGGMISTLLDEIMVKAVLLIRKYAMTVEMTCRYKKAVPIGQELRLVARLTRQRGRLFETSAEIRHPDGTVYATATGKYLEVPNKLRETLL
jgi:uncharacterized protein (TIGR00369 family)